MQPGGFAKPIPQMARSAVHKSDGPMDKEAIENASEKPMGW